MQIKTRDQELTPNELLLVYYWHQRGMGVAVLALFLAGLAFGRLDLACIPLILALFLVLAMRRSVLSKANRVFFAKRRYEMDDTYLNTYMADGSMGKLAWSNFHKAVRFRKSYLLFLSEIQFYYISDGLFYTDADRAAFEAFLKDRGLLKEKKKMSGFVRFLFETLFFLVWVVCVLAGLAFYFAEWGDAVTAYLLSCLIFTYPVFQAVRLARLLRKKG